MENHDSDRWAEPVDVVQPVSVDEREPPGGKLYDQNGEPYSNPPTPFTTTSTLSATSRTSICNSKRSSSSVAPESSLGSNNRPTPTGSSSQPPKHNCKAENGECKRWERVEDFAEETSIHGIGLWVLANKKPYFRIIFFLVWLAMLICLALLVKTTLVSYYARNTVITKSQISRRTAFLPAIMICPNHGGYTKSLHGGSPFSLQSFGGTYWGMTNESLFETCYDSTIPNHTPNETVLFDKILGPNMAKQYLEVVTLGIDSMFVKCWLSRQEMNCRDLVISRPTIDGQCFAFNYNGTLTEDPMSMIDMFNRTEHSLREVRGTGYQNALTLRLDARSFDYCWDKTDGEHAGYKILIHDQNGVPMTSDTGVIASPGTRTQIAVTETLNDKSDVEQYGHCISRKNMSLADNDAPYSKSTCLADCVAFEVWKNCRCNWPNMPFSIMKALRVFNELHPIATEKRATLPILQENGAVCYSDPNATLCFRTLILRFRRGLDLQHCHDECLTPCIEKEFKYSTAIGRFPVANKMKTMIGETAPRYNTSAEIRDNILEVDVYFSDLNQDRVRTQLAMPPSALLNNLGGALGLFLGVSAFSVMEVIVLILEFVTGWTSKKAIDE